MPAKKKAGCKYQKQVKEGSSPKRGIKSRGDFGRTESVSGPVKVTPSARPNTATDRAIITTLKENNNCLAAALGMYVSAVLK